MITFTVIAEIVTIL